MKKIFFILLFIVTILQSNTNTENLLVFANNNTTKIELKWFTRDYSSKYTYKLYRRYKKEKPKLIAVIKPVSYKILKSRGYNRDYIFMIYPFRETKSTNDKIEVLKVAEQVQGFRILKWMRDNSFAINLGQYFIDKSVEKDKLYTYKLEAYKNKKIVYQRFILAHTYKHHEKNDFLWISAKNTIDGVELNWDVNDAFAYYNVYRKIKGEKRFLKINKELLFIGLEHAKKSTYLYVDRDLKVGQIANYYVRKIDMFNKEGKASSEVRGKKKEAYKKPKGVSNIFVKSSDKKIMLRWKKSYNTLGYNVYRSTIYQGGFIKLNKKPIKKELFFDKNFQTDKNYYYYITAVNIHGESNPSVTMLAFARDTTPPTKPNNLKVSVKPGLVKLTWDSVKAKDLLGYRVYESMDMDAKQWSLVDKKEIKKNQYSYKKLKTLSRFPYFYRVSAVDKNFNESLPSLIVKAKLPDVTAPREPSIMKYLAYTNKIEIEWEKILVYDLSYYNIYRKEDKGLIKINKKPLIASSFVDLKPVSGANKYVVTAVDKSGNESNKSKFKIIFLKDNKPVKIENFKLTKIKNSIKASFTTKDKDYAGFKLFRSSGSILNYYNISNFIKNRSFTDKRLTRGKKYFYMIKAYDKAGNISQSKVLEAKIK